MTRSIENVLGLLGVIHCLRSTILCFPSAELPVLKLRMPSNCELIVPVYTNNANSLCLPEESTVHPTMAVPGG
jgi:hypothetical protein